MEEVCGGKLTLKFHIPVGNVPAMKICQRSNRLGKDPSNDMYRRVIGVRELKEVSARVMVENNQCTVGLYAVATQANQTWMPDLLEHLQLSLQTAFHPLDGNTSGGIAVDNLDGYELAAIETKLFVGGIARGELFGGSKDNAGQGADTNDFEATPTSCLSRRPFCRFKVLQMLSLYQPAVWRDSAMTVDTGYRA